MIDNLFEFGNQNYANFSVGEEVYFIHAGHIKSGIINLVLETKFKDSKGFFIYEYEIDADESFFHISDGYTQTQSEEEFGLKPSFKTPEISRLLQVPIGSYTPSNDTIYSASGGETKSYLIRESDVFDDIDKAIAYLANVKTSCETDLNIPCDIGDKFFKSKDTGTTVSTTIKPKINVKTESGVRISVEFDYEINLSDVSRIEAKLVSFADSFLRGM